MPEPPHITPPDPGLTADDVVARARELVPYLRRMAPEIEAAGHVPVDVDRTLREAGLYRMLQPRRAGGYEFSLGAYIDAMLEVYRGDPSAGWVASFMSAHVLWITALDDTAQREVFGADGDTRCVVTATPTGVAVPVEGGYRVTGRWDYCSGLSVSNWLIACAVVQQEPPPAVPEVIVFATPSSTVQAEDNWRVLGLRGTGSVSASAADVFVPSRFCMGFGPFFFESNAPGTGTHENPLYRAPILPVLWIQLAVAAVGITRGLIDVFVEQTASKPDSFPPFAPMSEDKKVQSVLGNALANHAVAAAALRQMSANHVDRMHRVAAGARIEWPDVQADHLLATKVARLCVEAADSLFHVAGSSLPVRSDSPFQRFYRDLKVASTHRALSLERAAENGGMMAFGLAPATQF